MPLEMTLPQLLAEIGFMAGAYGYFEESDAIFTALGNARPDNEIPVIGLAVTAMHRGQHREAVRMLIEKALRINPRSDFAKSFLGLALTKAGLTSESRNVLLDLVANGQNQNAKELARAILAE